MGSFIDPRCSNTSTHLHYFLNGGKMTTQDSLYYEVLDERNDLIMMLKRVVYYADNPEVGIKHNMDIIGEAKQLLTRHENEVLE